MIIDATNLLVGRLATKVAKLALLGETIDIVNAEKAVISGDPVVTIQKFKQRQDRGAPLIGPYYPKQPHLILRRMIRGMIDYKSARGKEAYGRIKCYRSIPPNFDTSKLVRFEEADVSRLPVYKFVTLERVSQVLGGKV